MIDMRKLKFWLSIKPVSKCYFSRRNGFFGKIIFGYSVCLRLFGKEIFPGNPMPM